MYSNVFYDIIKYMQNKGMVIIILKRFVDWWVLQQKK